MERSGSFSLVNCFARPVSCSLLFELPQQDLQRCVRTDAWWQWWEVTCISCARDVTLIAPVVSLKIDFFSRERLRRVLRKKAAVILHLHTFTFADDIFTPSHLLIYIFTTSHLQIYIFTPSHLQIYTFTPSHLQIYIFTPSHLQI